MRSLTAPLPPTAPVAVVPGPAPLDGRASATMLLLCLIWSLQQISLKAAAPEASPMLMVALRSLIATALLLMLMRRRGEGLGAGRWRPGMVAGGLFGLEYLLVSEALRLTAAGHVVVFLYTSPLFAAVGLHLRLPAERLSGRAMAGIGLAFAGIALTFLGGSDAASAGGSAASASLLGDALALLAGAAWGATTVTIRCSSLAEAPATETLLYQLVGAFALLLPAAALTGRWHFDLTPSVAAHLAFQSLVVSFASFLTWCWLLRTYLASRLGVFAFVTPLFGLLLGALLLGEALEPAFLAGSALVLAGIALVSVRPLRL
jgi:drug/metabolite transporter (DMT)-like permease